METGHLLSTERMDSETYDHSSTQITVDINYTGSLFLYAPVNSIYITSCKPVVYIHSMKGANLTTGETFITCEHTPYLEHNMNVSRIQFAENYYSRYSCHARDCPVRSVVENLKTEYNDNYCMFLDDGHSLSISDKNTCDVGNFLRAAHLLSTERMIR
jgi:hypothetical protein